MIIGLVRGDIFGTPLSNIVFAVNSDGINDSGFAGQVSRRFWPELAYIGPQPLGTVLTRTNGKTYHALVCHTLARDGWINTPMYLRMCLEKLNLPEGTYIASVAIGYGPVGRTGGADTYAILNAFAQSKYRIVIFTRN